jgi:hypothetical protein
MAIQQRRQAVFKFGFVRHLATQGKVEERVPR